MMITLQKIVPALASVGVGSERVDTAIEELKKLLAELNEVEVKGRDKVDTLLGCMMAIEAIIGEDKPNG